MLRIVVNNIPKPGLKISTRLPIEWLAPLVFEHVYEARADVDLQLTVKRKAKEVLVLATLSTKLHVNCSRCCATFDEDIELKFKQNYFPARRDHDEISELDDGSETLDTFHYRGPEIDLEAGVREHFVFTLNPHPVCKPECDPQRLTLLIAESDVINEQLTDPRWDNLKLITID